MAFRAHHKKGFKYKRSLFFIILPLLAVLLLVFATDIFKVKYLDISGSDNPVFSPLKEIIGRRYIFSPLTLPSDPAVASVTVRRHWFSRGITLEVTDRTAWGVWCSTDSRDCLWFDETGIAFRSALWPSGSLVRLVEANYLPALGEAVLPPKLLNNFLSIDQILAALSYNSYRAKIDDLNHEEIIVYLTDDNLPVYFSLRLNPDFTRQALVSLRDKFSDLQYIDLRSDNRAYYK